MCLHEDWQYGLQPAGSSLCPWIFYISLPIIVKRCTYNCRKYTFHTYYSIFGIDCVVLSSSANRNLIGCSIGNDIWRKSGIGFARCKLYSIPMLIVIFIANILNRWVWMHDSHFQKRRVTTLLWDGIHKNDWRIDIGRQAERAWICAENCSKTVRTEFHTKCTEDFSKYYF